MQTWIERISKTTKARDETDLPWMKKMKGERVEEEGKEGKKSGMMIQRQKLATSYTSLDGYTFRSGPAQTLRPSPPSLREVNGPLGPRRAQGEVEDWGE